MCRLTEKHASQYRSEIFGILITYNQSVGIPDILETALIRRKILNLSFNMTLCEHIYLMEARFTKPLIVFHDCTKMCRSSFGNDSLMTLKWTAEVLK